MRPHRSILVGTIVATLTLVTACGSSGSTASNTSATTTKPAMKPAACESSVPYAAGEGGYASYRIPAVITTGDGTILAFVEGRRNGTADHGDIETLLRRSTDGGCTWTKAQVVSSVKGQNRNNPAPVYDPATKQVILLTLGRPVDVTELQIRSGSVPSSNSMRVYQQTSDDEGVTFSDPVEITDQIKKSDWRWYAVGPGHGIVLTRGEHKGRIVFGANHSITPPAGSAANPMNDTFLAAHAIYSDDNGKTWKIGYVQDNTDGVVNGNESTAAQTPDGKVVFNVRNQNGSAKSHRAGGISTDGGASLTAPLAPIDSLAKLPVIEASLLQPSGPKHAPLLLSGPTDSNKRIGMAIYASADGGVTWAVAETITRAPAAYSDLVQLDPHTIGLLYETGTKTENDTITFVRIPLAALVG